MNEPVAKKAPAKKAPAKKVAPARAPESARSVEAVVVEVPPVPVAAEAPRTSRIPATPRRTR